MLGAKSSYAPACFADGFVGADFDIATDLSRKLPEDWKLFNREFVPVWLRDHPQKTKISAGLACGALWTVAKGMREGDVLLCPDGNGSYRIGEVVSGYSYRPGGPLPHRRSVKWTGAAIARTEMSDGLRNSCGSIATVCNVTTHAEEIERLLGATAPPRVVSTDASVEDAAEFVMERHLEDFLVENWAQTELGRDYDIFEEDGERVGQQYPTDTGPMDVLAISKDRKRLLVVELKKGRATDAVVGQTLRYMGYVQEELAEPGQEVRGVIIAQDQDERLRRALGMVPTISFYRYQVSFRLIKGA